MWAFVNTYLSTFGVKTILCAVIIPLLFKYILNKVRRDPRLVKFAAQFPGPDALPVIGNTIDFMFCGGSIEKVTKYADKYGPRFRLWLGNDLVIVLQDPADLDDIASNPNMVHKSKIFEGADEFLGTGLLTIKRAHWKPVRQRLQSFFSRNMSQYVPLINEHVYICMKKMQDLAGDGVHNLWNVVPNMTFDIIMDYLFNMEISERDKAWLQMHDAIKRMSEVVIEKMFEPWRRIKFIEYCLYKEDKNMFSDRTRRLMNMILPTKKSEDSLNGESKPMPQSAFLTILSQIQKTMPHFPKYTENEIVTEIGGGTDTVAATMSAFLLSIAMHPEIQNKLHKELHQVFGDDDRAADINDVDRLPYLDQVLKETQRRFTVIPIGWRGVDEDTKIGSFVYPTGTSIIVSMVNVHFNPKYYPNPLTFNPENFSPEAVSKRPKLAFIPFGLGYRNCAGKSFAMLEMKLALTALLRTFTFHTTMRLEDVKMTIGFVSVIKDGYKVSIKRRDRALTISDVSELQSP